MRNLIIILIFCTLNQDNYAQKNSSPNEENGIINKTQIAAQKLKRPTQYSDAIPDLENKINPKTMIIWGSSYSAVLTFFLARIHTNEINGILAFSRREYFKIQEKNSSLMFPKLIIRSLLLQRKKKKNSGETCMTQLRPITFK